VATVPFDASSDEQTTGGSYFVSNYPPYSFWNAGSAKTALDVLAQPPAADTALGFYLHIPFCRKRCHFCYFKVYTDKNASEVDTYLDALIAEIRLYAGLPVLGGRKPRFIYFGGGTPSYISTRQLGKLAEAMQQAIPWDAAKEIAFECEPGTLTEGKLRAIRDLGVTRLSLGIENFDDAILKANGRAHLSKEIGRAYDYARSIGFPQINIDLIAGMMGETEENWKECVRRTIELDPDSVTIYQMEIPFNTTIFKEMKASGQSVAPVATWGTKRRWVQYAFEEFEKAGYTIGSAYTAVKDPAKAKFLYRDLLWRGADMIGLGVASFSHVQGVNYQNEHEFGAYCARTSRGELPVYRAIAPTPDERFLREFILQMKLGRVSRRYFEDKFGQDIHRRFEEPLRTFEKQGLAVLDPEGIRLQRAGLMQVDKLLHQFFLPQHQPQNGPLPPILSA